MKLAQRAGMVCNEGAFWRFLGVDNKDAAVRRLRRVCGISSRRDLDSDKDAAQKFTTLTSEYEAWLRE